MVRQLVLEKENSELKPVKLRLKIDLVSYPTRAEGLVNMIILHLDCYYIHYVSTAVLFCLYLFTHVYYPKEKIQQKIDNYRFPLIYASILPIINCKINYRLIGITTLLWVRDSDSRVGKLKTLEHKSTEIL